MHEPAYGIHIFGGENVTRRHIRHTSMALPTGIHTSGPQAGCVTRRNALSSSMASADRQQACLHNPIHRMSAAWEQRTTAQCFSSHSELPLSLWLLQASCTAFATLDAVTETKTLTCGMIASCFLRESSAMLAVSTPSKTMEPMLMSISLNRLNIKLLLPLPVGSNTPEDTMTSAQVMSSAGNRAYPCGHPN